MIILPDRNIPRARFLIPTFDKDWRTPSEAQPKDQFGNENTTSFKISAKSNDGVILWTGWFDDRADFDAFLWAITLGTLKQEKELWNLPTPNWHPYLGDVLSYDFATTTFLTTPTNTNQSYTMPNDFNQFNNNIQCIGGGGSGGGANGVSLSRASGGGGGAWNRTNNVPAVRNAVEYYYIAGGGAGFTVTTSGTGPGQITGNAGGDTWFSINNAAPTSTSEGVLAKGGGGGNATSNTACAGGTGGVGSSGIGTSSFDGGSGGAGNHNNAGTGGGGAAGPNGAGASGTATTGTLQGTAGGRGDNNTGGTGSAGAYTFAGNSTSTAGGNGSEIQASPAYGSGGGSGASAGSGLATSGAGGLYGGASGGARGAGGAIVVGAGRQGLIIITYEPLTRFGQPFNMPMLGM